MTFSDWLGLMNLIVLAITLLVLCRYVFDTFKMQKAMSRQVELQIKPLIAIEPVDKTMKGFFLNISNIGNGTALNVEFDPMLFDSASTDLQFTVPQIRSLKAGESKEVKVTPLLDGQRSDYNWTAHLKPQYANRVIHLTLNYNDIEFKNISQSFELGLGDLRIKMTK